MKNECRRNYLKDFLRYLAVYFFIGGIILGLISNRHYEKCDERISDNVALMVILLWPSLLGAAIVLETDETSYEYKC